MSVERRLREGLKRSAAAVQPDRGRRLPEAITRGRRRRRARRASLILGTAAALAAIGFAIPEVTTFVQRIQHPAASKGSPAAGITASATASPSPTATAGTITNDVHSPMPPGWYRTVQFRPPFRFSTTVTVGGGADAPDVANFSLKIYGHSNFAEFFFARFAKVCDPTAPSRLTAPPNSLLACLVHNPHLRVTAGPAPVTIGGISGQQLDVQVVGKLPGPPSCNNDPYPCVRVGTTPGFPPTAGGLGIEAGNSARIWILDVHGTTVAVVWRDLTARFASNLAAAEKIMQTVRFS